MNFCMKQIIGIGVCVGVLSCLTHLWRESASRDAVGNPLQLTHATQSPLRSTPAGDAGRKNKESFAELLAVLATAQEKASALASYTAILEMQEDVDGELRPLDRIHLKFRQKPFSVYMRWADNNQEVLFVEGKNDNRLLVKPAKGLAALMRVLHLDPDSPMAKQTFRYSITDSGLENLVNRIQKSYAARDDWSSVAECSVSDATVSNIDVTAYDVRFLNSDVSPDYSGSRFYFDKRSGLLIGLDNFGWSDEPQPRLIEHYRYLEINPGISLQDDDFEEANPEYEFVAR